MVRLLDEMQRGYSRVMNRSEWGDLAFFFNTLARAAAGADGRPRSLPAMRQAWYRWTTEGTSAGTPSVGELALMARHASLHGWLDQLQDPECRDLVTRLLAELDERQTSQRRALEVAWSPTARVAVEGLMDFLEERIAKRAGGRGTEGHFVPSAIDVQEEVRVMVQEVVQHMVLGLAAPRELFVDPRDEDAWLQPFEGWPECFRSAAKAATEVFHDAAKEYEVFEDELRPSPPPDGIRRGRLFRRSPEDEPDVLE